MTWFLCSSILSARRFCSNSSGSTRFCGKQSICEMRGRVAVSTPGKVRMGLIRCWKSGGLSDSVYVIVPWWWDKELVVLKPISNSVIPQRQICSSEKKKNYEARSITMPLQNFTTIFTSLWRRQQPNTRYLLIFFLELSCGFNGVMVLRIKLSLSLWKNNTTRPLHSFFVTRILRLKLARF